MKCQVVLPMVIPIKSLRFLRSKLKMQLQLGFKLHFGHLWYVYEHEHQAIHITLFAFFECSTIYEWGMNMFSKFFISGCD
jgi:hypothetical protein